MNPLPTELRGPLVAIGDLHGQASKLAGLLERIGADLWGRTVVFLGDFVDRGDDVRGALDLVLALGRQQPIAAVCGNHDHALAAALGLFPSPDECRWADRYVRWYDAQPTFASYGVTNGSLSQLAGAMPESHRLFLASLPWIVTHPEYVFVHAGLLPDRPAGEQIDALRTPDRSLNRPAWLCDVALAHAPVPSDERRIVVSGHAPVHEVVFGDRRILLDTTGGRSGKLSAVLLPEHTVIQSA